MDECGEWGTSCVYQCSSSCLPEVAHRSHSISVPGNSNEVSSYRRTEHSDVVFPFTLLGHTAAHDVILMTVSYDSYRTSVQGELQITAHYLHSISSNMGQWLQRVAEIKLDTLLLENMHL